MTSHARRSQVLATDYDGTLTEDGAVAPAVLDGLLRLRDSGRRLVLVTGRELEDLASVFPDLHVFDRIVAENGGVLYTPASGDIVTLGAAPDGTFVARLRDEGVTPLFVGRVIVATRTPHDVQVARAIAALDLDLDITYNKGAVMVLPKGIDKATGLRHALEDLRMPDADTIGIGDAENDEALLQGCTRAVAVANAVAALRSRAHEVTHAPAGEGVLEIIEALLASDESRP